MQNPFDNTNINPQSFDLQEYLTSISIELADDFPIDVQDPTYSCTAPADQGRTGTIPVRSSSSMAHLTGFETQASDPFALSSPIPMPQFGGSLSDFGLHQSLPLSHGAHTLGPPFELQLRLQRLAQSQANLPQPGLQSSPISPSESTASVPALSRSSSDRRQATPSASDDTDASPLPNLPSNATAKERADYKREQNKRAARRARRRREAQVSRMESDIGRLQREADIWRERVRMMEGLLEQAGIVVPSFPEIE